MGAIAWSPSSELVELLKSGSTSNCSGGGEERSSRCPLPRPEAPGDLSWWSKDVSLPWPQDNVEDDDVQLPESANTPRPLLLSCFVIVSPAKPMSASIGWDGWMICDGWMLATQLSRNDSNRIFFAVGSAISLSDRLAMMIDEQNRSELFKREERHFIENIDKGNSVEKRLVHENTRR